MQRPYTLTSDDRDLLLIALRQQQSADLECAQLSVAIGYADAAKAFERECDHAEGLVRVLERSDKIHCWSD